MFFDPEEKKRLNLPKELKSIQMFSKSHGNTKEFAT